MGFEEYFTFLSDLLGFCCLFFFFISSGVLHHFLCLTTYIKCSQARFNLSRMLTNLRIKAEKSSIGTCSYFSCT